MVKKNKFGMEGCFKCRACSKRTRDTIGNAMVELCEACYKRCMMENEHNDHDGNHEYSKSTELMQDWHWSCPLCKK